jgi:hypothetical protein
MKFNSEKFALYLAFVEARHQVWEERQVGAPAPWTSDPIVASRKFTNVFRILDPGSQFIFDLQAENPYDTLMRLFLYRHTGRVGAWQHLAMEFGEYPHLADLDDVLEVWKEYRAAGHPVFTGAYLVYPQSSSPGTDKLESIIRLTQRLFDGENVAQDFVQARSQEDRFKVLRRNKGVADFMSMQILTDWGYTTYAGKDLENEFVVPGPGCRKGISHLTDTPDQVAFLRFAQAEVLMGDNVPTLHLPSGERYPSIMDIQNTMCEFSKYIRFWEKGTAGKPYVPAHPGKQPEPVLPAHWATTN